MLHRREFLLGAAGAGIAILGESAAAQTTDPVRAMLEPAVGRREPIAGMIAVAVDDGGAALSSYGNSGAPGLAMNGETVFEIGSITKVLTALLLADMEARGEVSFDDPVADHLPPSAAPGVRGRPITLLDLATYTSGLPGMPDNMPPGWQTSGNPLSGYTPDMLYEFLAGHTPAYEPGAHYEYANLGYGALGLALAHRAGKSFEALLVERICDPLGIDDTRITLSPGMQARAVQGLNLDVQPSPFWDMPALQGAGAARSTANDLVLFLRACMRLDRTPLDGAFARLIETRRPTPLAGTQAGLGWFVSSNDSGEIVWKTGVTGGCNSFIGYSPQSRRGAVVLANFLSRPAGGGPVDGTVIGIGMSMIAPGFDPGDLMRLYR